VIRIRAMPGVKNIKPEAAFGGIGILNNELSAGKAV